MGIKIKNDWINSKQKFDTPAKDQSKEKSILLET